MPIPLGVLAVAGAGKAPPTPPAILTSADLWLDASDASTITQAGGAVSQWNNKGTKGNFTQASGAVQPTTNASTLNGLNVIDFAGDYVTATNTNEWKFLHDGTIFIFAAVVKLGTVANPADIYAIWGTNGLSSFQIGNGAYYEDRSPANDAYAVYATTGGGGPSTVLYKEVNDGLAANTFVLSSAYFDLSNATANSRAKLYKNGGADLGGTNTFSTTPSTSNPTNALQIGASGGGAFPLTGSIAELIIISGANATDANRQVVRDYLNDKWAVY